MYETLGHLTLTGWKYNFSVALAEIDAIHIPDSNSGKGIPLMNSSKDSASQQFQCDPRWYPCKNGYAYDAFGTGVHSSCVTDCVVNFNVELKNKKANLTLTDKIVFHLLGCF